MARRWKVVNKKTGREVWKTPKISKAAARGHARRLNALHRTRRYVVVEV